MLLSLGVFYFFLFYLSHVLCLHSPSDLFQMEENELNRQNAKHQKRGERAESEGGRESESFSREITAAATGGLGRLPLQNGGVLVLAMLFIFLSLSPAILSRLCEGHF